MRITDDDEDEEFNVDDFHVRIDIDGQTVEADCSIWLAKIANINLTSPYRGVYTQVRVEEEKGNFYDHKEAISYIEKTMREVMEQIGYVLRYRKEYEEAYEAYHQFHEKRMKEIKERYPVMSRERFQQVVQTDKEARCLYRNTLSELIKLPEDEHEREVYYIFPTLLNDILEATHNEEIH